MAMASVVWLFLFWFACLSLSVMAKRTYIVQMNHHQKPLSFATHDDWYSASLQSLSSSPDDLLYTYSTTTMGRIIWILTITKKPQAVVPLLVTITTTTSTKKKIQLMMMVTHRFKNHNCIMRTKMRPKKSSTFRILILKLI